MEPGSNPKISVANGAMPAQQDKVASMTVSNRLVRYLRLTITMLTELTPAL